MNRRNKMQRWWSKRPRPRNRCRIRPAGWRRWSACSSWRASAKKNRFDPGAGEPLFYVRRRTRARRAWQASEHELDHLVSRQGAIQVVELRAAGGAHGDGQRQVVTLRGGTHLDLAGMESRIVFDDHLDDGIGEFIVHDADDFDRKVARIFDQGFFGRG